MPDKPEIYGNREFIFATVANRYVPLHKGDEVTVCIDEGIKPGEYWNGRSFMCVRRNKRDKWWQFWKPKYKSTTFRYMGESQVTEFSIHQVPPPILTREEDSLGTNTKE